MAEFDISHLPGMGSDRQIFYANSPTTAATWSSWRKPRNAAMVQIICLAGGGGGGGARNSVIAPTAGAGGAGGGGSSSQSIIILPASAIPDTLYISVGSGGLGGTAAAVGKVGIESYVSVAPINVGLNNIVMANPGNPGGSGGTGTVGGITGTGGSIAGITMMCLGGLGNYSLLAGQDGTLGSPFLTPVTNPIVLPTTGLFITGGQGGAYNPSTGTGSDGIQVTSWTINSSALLYPPVTSPPVADGSGPIGATGENGVNGLSFINGMGYHYGGGGGGSAAYGTGGTGGGGGDGGSGGFGCGGGGGGAGASNSGGIGGDGGNGIVIVTCW